MVTMTEIRSRKGSCWDSWGDANYLYYKYYFVFTFLGDLTQLNSYYFVRKFMVCVFSDSFRLVLGQCLFFLPRLLFITRCCCKEDGSKGRYNRFVWVMRLTVFVCCGNLWNFPSTPGICTNTYLYEAQLTWIIALNCEISVSARAHVQLENTPGKTT